MALLSVGGGAFIFVDGVIDGVTPGWGRGMMPLGGQEGAVDQGDGEKAEDNKKLEEKIMCFKLDVNEFVSFLKFYTRFASKVNE